MRKYPDNNLRMLRMMAGLTQDSLADLVAPKTDGDMISKIENGQRELTHTWMERLARPLNCNPKDLIGQIGSAGDDKRGMDEAILYLFKDIFKLLLNKKQPITKEKLERDLIYALARFQQEELPGAVWVMGNLLEYVKAEAPQKRPQTTRKPLLLSPPV